MSGFRKFLLRGNVVDLAIAVVIGAAFGAVVAALVEDLITPILGVFGGLPDFNAWSFTINGSKFAIGHFINAVLAFVILALIIYYLVVLPLQRMMDRYKPSEPAPEETRECPYCLSKIPRAASRCSFCTSEVDPIPAAAASRVPGR